MKATNRRRRSPGSRSLRRVLTSLVISVALVATGTIVASPAYADDYPTWDDVQAAQANETNKQAEIQRIQDLISSLKSATQAAQKLSEQRGTEYHEAQNKFDTANFKADELKAQADEAQGAADASMRQAGQLAALMAKSGGSGLSANLFTSESGDAESLLYRLGTMSQLTGSTSKVYAKAEQDKNTAQSLTDQAQVARDELAALAAEAKKARDEAVTAQKAAENSLAEQQSHEVDLETQLSVLTQNRQATEADYNAGVAERKRLAEEAAAAAAAARESVPVASGWASPFPGSYSTDEYGMRTNPVSGAYILHSGIDLNYNTGTCGAPVYAASSGQVSYAGYNGGYGNFVEIDSGGGVSTAYGHNTSLAVSNGEFVGAGQLISYAGTTGNSTGCHVHFEVRINERAIDPRPFMADQGIFFG